MGEASMNNFRTNHHMPEDIPVLFPISLSLEQSPGDWVQGLLYIQWVKSVCMLHANTEARQTTEDIKHRYFSDINISQIIRGVIDLLV